MNLRSDLKELAVKIHEDKAKRKGAENGHVFGLAEARHVYRHMHIVYCLKRGRAYKDIEPRVREGNEPQKALLDRITLTYAEPPLEGVA